MRRCALIPLLLALASCGRPSTILDASYGTMDDAKHAGAFERGWLPQWLPTTSTGIREIHDVDTNASSLLLSFSAGEAWAAPTSCVKVTGDQVAQPRLTPSWWPTGVPSALGLGASYVYYSCASSTEPLRESMAVEEKSRVLLHWRS
jgi:hypothetical protein